MKKTLLSILTILITLSMILSCTATSILADELPEWDAEFSEERTVYLYENTWTGTTVNKRTFDEFGNLCSLTETNYYPGSGDYFEPIVTEYIYDHVLNDQGLIIEETVYCDGLAWDTTYYEYDEHQNLISQVVWNEYTTYATDYDNEYNDAGQLVSKTEHVTIGSDDFESESYVYYAYTYDEKGQLVKEETRGDNELISPTVTSYRYNENGDLIESINEYTEYDGSVCTTTVSYGYLYDENGRLIKSMRDEFFISSYTTGNSVFSSMTYTY